MPEAAVALGVSRSRVHALLHSGEIRGRKVGMRWLVDETSVRARAGAPRIEGRPLSPRQAWAYLLLLSGEKVPWIDASSRSRLRRRIAGIPVREALPRLRRRAKVHHYRAGSSAVREIAAAPGFVASGVSASSAVNVPLVVRDQAEGYVSERALVDLVYALALSASDPGSSNVVLRVSAYPAALRGRKFAPVAAIAADLLESSDQRVRRAGDQLAERLRADRH